MHRAVRRSLVAAGAILVTMATLVLGFPLASNAVAPSPATRLTSAVTPASRGYQVIGNKVIGPAGQQFIPYGFVVYCLAEKDITCNDTPTSTDPVTDTNKIRTAASFWHADVIRFQVAEQNLLPNGSVDQAFLARLKADVQLTNSLGMVAIVTDQEQYFHQPPLPLAAAVPFWSAVASVFRDNPMVFFDLYNEPRLAADTTTSPDGNWNLWRNGGPSTVDGTSYQFVGMQALVDQIRAIGANNVIVAEGLKADKDLSGIPRFALHGSNIAYGMEPDLKPNDATPTQWAANFGNLSDTIPIMMEAFQDWPGAGSCNVDSPTLVPKLLTYLRSKHLGLIAWALTPGVMMVGNNPEVPTSYAAITTNCPITKGKKHRASIAASLQSNTEGPGALLLAYFRAEARPFPSAPAVVTQPGVTPSSGFAGDAQTWAAVAVSLGAAVIIVALLLVRSRRRRPLR